uniref:Uncharacterized protein n=1 Tax=Arundo donax TaxID=35708 RepID=A0A0A9R0Q7_ARUDO
MVPFIVPE